MLPLTIAVSSIHTHSVPSRRVLLAAGIVALGFILGVAPHTFATIQWRSAPSSLSIVYGVLSSLFIAVHAVLIKSSLPHAHNSTIQLAYWQNLGSALFLAPFILIQGEYGQLLGLMSRRDWNGGVFVWGSIITGVFGFLLCVAGLLSIKVTSPITHMFSSVSIPLVKRLLRRRSSVAHLFSRRYRRPGCPLGHPDAAGRVALWRPSHQVRPRRACSHPSLRPSRSRRPALSAATARCPS